MNFVKENNAWVSTYTSEGSTLVQLNRNSSGFVRVSIKITGSNNYAVIGVISAENNTAFNVDVTAGVSVKIESESEVLSSYTKSNG